MIKMIRLIVKKAFVKKLRAGYPLIDKDAIENKEVLQKEGSIVGLFEEKGTFLGKGYYGIQNKGIGWVLSQKEQEEMDEAFFEKKLKAAISLREEFFETPETTAFRLFNGEGDGIGGLTIDYFAGYLLIHWYSAGIYQFKGFVLKAIDNALSYKGIYEKKRFDQKGTYIEDDDFVKGERGEFPIIIKENGINFAVYLNDGAMVGIFLDQRDVRKTIRDKYAEGKKVLNTFSYTGAFSVAAALGEAVKTTSVDLANRSKNKTMEQFSINEIDVEKQDIIVEDVFHYFKYAGKKGLKFDMVILDPPSFARSKKQTFRAAKDYSALLKEVIAITEKNGVIVASTNCSTFGMNTFKGFVETAFKESREVYSTLEEFTLPKDFKTIQTFKEGNYLKVLFLKKLS
jgi:23S rRNA (cytosine1962-C5)-methyltransferase